MPSDEWNQFRQGQEISEGLKALGKSLDNGMTNLGLSLERVGAAFIKFKEAMDEKDEVNKSDG